MIDQVKVEERAAFAKRSIKTSAHLACLKLAISMMDFDDARKGKRLSESGCSKATQPMHLRYRVPPWRGLRLPKLRPRRVVWANTYNKFDPTSPFDGHKEGGFGREGGLHGLRPYVALD